MNPTLLLGALLFACPVPSDWEVNRVALPCGIMPAPLPPSSQPSLELRRVEIRVRGTAREARVDHHAFFRSPSETFAIARYEFHIPAGGRVAGVEAVAGRAGRIAVDTAIRYGRLVVNARGIPPGGDFGVRVRIVFPFGRHGFGRILIPALRLPRTAASLADHVFGEEPYLPPTIPVRSIEFSGRLALPEDAVPTSSTHPLVATRDGAARRSERAWILALAPREEYPNTDLMIEWRGRSER